MSDTPETDAASFDYDARAEYWVDAEFARKLERAMNNNRQIAEKYEARYFSTLAERDELKKQISEIEKYGTEEINAAVELRSKLAASLVERDEYKRRWQDWERWAKQVVQHFRRVPIDTATVGMRNTLTRWMQEMKDQK